MSKTVKVRTHFLALILLVFAAGNVYAADKVVVIPMGGGAGVSPALEGRIETLESLVATLESLVGTLESEVSSLQSLHTGTKHATAFGRINQYFVGTQYTEGVSEVVWNSTYNRYELTLTDAYYSIDDAASVTINGDSGNCPAGSDGRVGSVSGKMLVMIVDSDGNNIECSFSFIVFAD